MKYSLFILRRAQKELAALGKTEYEKIKQASHALLIIHDLLVAEKMGKLHSFFS